MLRLGLVINPLAGLGGPSALKGSDGAATVTEARARGAEPKAEARASSCLRALANERERIQLLTWGGAMGADAASDAGWPAEILGQPATEATSASDTREAARSLCEAQVDLLLFVGGDGTARDICDVVRATQPVLGVPAGVKMHSGVYAVSPQAAAEVVLALLQNELVGAELAEVRDIDEAELRAGRVNSRWYGELLVPSAPRWVQHTKIGGRESESLALQEIAAWVAETILDSDPEACWVIGPGSTTAAVMEQLGLPNTLLGVDLIQAEAVLGNDLDAQTLLKLTADQQVHIVITAIGGQGHILGRGNQQLSPELIRRAGRDRILVIATRTKLKALEGRPLRVDTGDAELDRALRGPLQVLTGYDDRVLYPVE